MGGEDDSSKEASGPGQAWPRARPAGTPASVLDRTGGTFTCVLLSAICVTGKG